MIRMLFKKFHLQITHCFRHSSSQTTCYGISAALYLELTMNSDFYINFTTAQSFLLLMASSHHFKSIDVPHTNSVSTDTVLICLYTLSRQIICLLAS